MLKDVNPTSSSSEVPVRVLILKTESKFYVVLAKLWARLLAGGVWSAQASFGKIVQHSRSLSVLHKTDGRSTDTRSSGAHGPQALFLHDVPQLTQVGLRDAVVGFELQRSEVISLCFLKLPIEVKDCPQVHQGCRILKKKKKSKVWTEWLNIITHTESRLNYLHCRSWIRSIKH